MGALAVGSRPPQQQRPAMLVGAVILIVLVGLRYRVGCDWQTYQDLFDYSEYSSFSTAIGLSDPAFGALNWLVASLGLGVWAVNLVCAAIFTAGLVTFCRWQPNPPLAMLVAVPYLVIVVAMGYTRQSAALGFIMFALTYYQRGSALGVVGSLLCAILFHKASILIFPFFGLSYARNVLVAGLIFAILSYAAYRLVVSNAVSILIYGYIKQEYSSSGATVRVLMNVVPAILLLGYRNRFGLNRNNWRLWILLSVASLAAVALLYLSPSSTAVDRASLFLIPLQVFVLSRVPSAFSKEGRHNMLLVVAVVAYSFAVEIVWLDFGQFSKCWIPYRSYLWSYPAAF